MTRRRDVGATEVLGYVFMLALAAVAAGVSLQAYDIARERGEDLAQSATVDTLANSVQAAVEDAVLVANLAPNATYNRTIEFPQTLTAGALLDIRYVGDQAQVFLRVPSWQLNATRNISTPAATTDAGITVQGSIAGTPPTVLISYRDTGANKIISIQGWREQ